MKTVSELRQVKSDLIEIWSSIDTPAKWTKRFYAIDKFGANILWTSPNACAFCISGAVLKHQGDHIDCYAELELTIGHDSIPEFNDRTDTTHSMVEKVFRDTFDRLDKTILELETK